MADVRTCLGQFCSVGIVAIGALHQAFVHAMVKGHGELRFLLEVAGVAKLGLGLDQQELLGLRVVRRMAGNAAHLILVVKGIRGLHMLDRRGMAREAAVVNFFGGVFGENENLGFVAASGHVGSAGTVATFASLVRRTTFGIERRLPMRSFLPTVVNILVAGLADFGAEVVGILRLAGGGGGILFRIGTRLIRMHA